MAKSFCVNPLSWRPFWINLATSNESEACFSSSLSWSNLAVFSVVPTCLFVAAPTKYNQKFNQNNNNNNTRVVEFDRLHLDTVSTSRPWRRAAFTTFSDLEETPFGNFFLIITGSHWLSLILNGYYLLVSVELDHEDDVLYGNFLEKSEIPP